MKTYLPNGLLDLGDFLRGSGGRRGLGFGRFLVVFSIKIQGLARIA